jgi:type I restriction enzyme, S subunit
MTNAMQKTLGEITETRVEQTGPNGREFTYVDIGSIELDTKRIVEPKVLPASKAPSRAKQVLKRGDVLVSMTRPNRNAVALVPPELDGAIGSTGFHVLRAKDAEPGFLFYAVQTNDFIDALCEKVQGALYPAVRPRDVSSFKTFLPASRTEQRRIVAEIEKQFTRLEAGVAALRRVQANLKRYCAAVLKAACEGKLVPTEAELSRSQSPVAPKPGKGGSTKNSQPAYEPASKLLERILTERRQNWQGRGKYKEPPEPNIANLPHLPEGWVWTRMDTVCTKVQDGTHFSPKEQSATGDFKYITAKNIKTWGLDLSELTYVPTHVHREISARCNPEKGDILFIKDGVTTGIATVNTLDEEFSLLSSVALLKPMREYLDSYFLKHWLNSPVGYRAMTGQMTGTAIKRVILEKIKGSAVPLPPLAEQTRIVAEVERRLSVVEELEAVVSANLQRAVRLRQSILQKAFIGELA